METLLAFVVLGTLVLTPISFLIFLVQKFKKLPNSKKWGVITLVSFVLFVASVVLMPTCEHEWVEADCESPKTCSLCEATEGEALGHSWMDPTCTDPRICDVCGLEEGGALGHEWVEATCAAAKHCSRCELTEGEPLAHTWKDATCLLPKTCAACSETEGEALGHDYSEMEIVKKASCTETGYAEGVCARCAETTGQEISMKEHKVGKWTTTLEATCLEDGNKEQKCADCGYTLNEVIPALGHKESEWQVIEKATYDAEGTRGIVCTRCKENLKTETYELTAEEAEKDYKKKCETIGYKDLCRNPGAYKDKLIKISGKVFQEVSEAESFLEYSVYFVKASGNLYCVMIDNYGSGTRILEDDKITIYGEVGDLLTYETVRGSNNTIPKIYAKYYN